MTFPTRSAVWIASRALFETFIFLPCRTLRPFEETAAPSNTAASWLAIHAPMSLTDVEMRLDNFEDIAVMYKGYPVDVSLDTFASSSPAPNPNFLSRPRWYPR